MSAPSESSHPALPRGRSTRMGGAFWRFWSVEVATETGLGLAVIALQTIVVLELGGGSE